MSGRGLTPLRSSGLTAPRRAGRLSTTSAGQGLDGTAVCEGGTGSFVLVKAQPHRSPPSPWLSPAEDGGGASLGAYWEAGVASGVDSRVALRRRGRGRPRNTDRSGVIRITVVVGWGMCPRHPWWWRRARGRSGDRDGGGAVAGLRSRGRSSLLVISSVDIDPAMGPRRGWPLGRCGTGGSSVVGVWRAARGLAAGRVGPEPVRVTGS